ncbi:MAG: hypothetical protein K0R23_3675 [Lacrimispora sp.]|nr:hypothetical protein [Lacrimispora sp.]
MLKKVQFEILEDGYRINDKMLLYPVNIEYLKQILGSGRFFEEERVGVDNQPFTYTAVVWDQYGICAILKDLVNTEDKGIAWRLLIRLKENDRSQKEDSPRQSFAGSIKVKGEELLTLELNRDDWFGEYLFGKSVIYIDFDDGEIEKVEIRSQRKRAEGKLKTNVDIQDKGICINEDFFNYPLDLAAIRKCLALKPDEISQEDNQFNNGISINLNDKGKEEMSIDLFYFDGQITINSKDLNKAKRKKDRYGYSAEGIYGDSKVYYSLNHSDGTIKYINVTQFNSALVEKYKMKETEEEILTFKDLNFKLLVLDELMYEKKLLQPEFDIYEFAEQYQQGEIDTATEKPVKAALDYFLKYPIEKRYASLITELTQNGNDIYMNIAPQWDGEDLAFDIKSAEDAKQFPNLKKVTITSNHFQKLLKQFEKFGIKAEQL